MSNTENQRAYKERMYAAGYKQTMVWIPRNPAGKTEKMSRAAFNKRLDDLTSGWSAPRLSGLYTVILSMIETKKGVRTANKT